MLLWVRVPYLSIKIWFQSQVLWQSQYLIVACVCKCPSRCGFSGGPGLPPGLGHPVLDQLHHIHHQQTHPGPKQSGCLREGGSDQALWGRPPTRVGPGWVSEVSRSFNSITFDIGFKIWLSRFQLSRVFTSLQNFSWVYWHCEQISAVLFQQEKRRCSSVPSSWFIDRLFDWFLSPFICSLTYMLIFCQGRPQRERALKALFFYFFYIATYCNINSDKWNWLPLDQRPALLRALKGSCFLVIPWMQSCLFKYRSGRAICLHEHTLKDQSWRIWNVIWWKFFQWQANCPR